ncbi:PREDICTED: uncharacterized protein LOC106126328 [Papilio xuthus]|uniref:Uncharacterized protein LOC106126328 n=1 Tax=Papilio xuthus TaxID=66420 RepID=A0AAJ6ZUQ0_PAPXU|nr:PREDICTED: uncharacterized protein LOC106126328 [Papilio xuthus]
MAVVNIFLQVFCVAAILSPLSASEESAQDFIEHVLRIPNPDKVLNSVLGRLERNRQLALAARTQQQYDEHCDEPSEVLPEYTETLPGSRERGLRQLGVQKHYPICHLDRKIRRLNTDEYEYRPAYYEEIRCTASSDDDVTSTNEICSSLGFSCVQWNKTIHLTRRRYSSDCWETKTMVIPAGCECMWPVHRLGDINLHV